MSIRPTAITRGGLTILGSWSGETAQYWRAMEFLKSNRHRFDFGAMFSRTTHLDEMDLAMKRMQCFGEIKPLMVPALSTD